MGINKIGKIGKLNLKANKKLKELYQKIGITRCELCGTDQWLSFAHRHLRHDYRGKELDEGLASYNQTLLLCVPKCHAEIEGDKEKTEDLFMKLRGDDQLS